MNKTAEKTLAMKARAFNKMRQEVWKVLKSYKGRSIQGGQAGPAPEDITLNPEKALALFKEWFELVRESHYELIAYKSKRKKKKEIHEERLANGYYEKKEAKAKAHSVNNKALPAHVNDYPILKGSTHDVIGKFETVKDSYRK